MKLSTFFTAVVTLASFGAALPAARKTKGTMCDLSKATWASPKGQTNLTAPTHPLSFIGLGVGTQNYTCNAAGTYASAGAVAEILDISCLYGTPAFDKVQDLAMQIWKKAPKSVTIDQIAAFIPKGGPAGNVVAGQHYFIPNGNATSPKWDFTSSGANKGNAKAYVVGAKLGGLSAPTGKQDVDWLQLKKADGSLADEIFRTDTRLGQPEASCTPGAKATSKYVSKYYFFGGQL